MGFFINMILGMRVLVFSILLHLLLGAAWAQEGRKETGYAPHLRVLVLSDTRIMAPWYETSLDSFRQAMREQHGIRISLEWEPVNMARYSDSTQRNAFLEEFAADHTEPEPDLVLTIQSAATFAFEQKERFFSTAPVVATLIDPSMLEGLAIPQGASAVVSKWRAQESVRTALELFPKLERMAVVVGNSPTELVLLNDIRTQLDPFADQLEFLWLGGMPYSEVRDHLAGLPENSAVLFVTFLQDSDGSSLVPHETVADLAKTTDLPIFVALGSQLGTGVLGGMVLDPVVEGQIAADQASLLLKGEPAPIRPLPAQPIFDWRVMQRFGLSVRNLPEGSIVRFGPQSIWELYRNELLIAAVAFLVLSLTATGLAINVVRRRRMEEHLKQSTESIRYREELLQKILEVLPVGVFISDETGRLVKTNPAADLIWGGKKQLPPDQLYEYKGWWKDSGKRVDEWAFSRAFNNGEISRDEVIDIECFDGSRKTILNFAAPVRNEAGEIISAVAVSMDITERVQIEQELRESEKKLRQIFSASPAFLVVSDPKSGRHVEVNDAYCELTGFTREEVVGKTSIELGIVDPGSREQRIQEIVSGGEKRGMEMDLRRKTGEIRSVFYSTNIIEQGGRQFFVSSGYDITERRRAEQELQNALEEAKARAREAEERASILETILEYFPEGMVITGGPPDFRLMAASRRGAEMTGKTADELLNLPTGEHQSAWGLWLPDGKTRPSKDDMPLYRASRFGEVTTYTELIMEDAVGRRFPVLVSAAPVRDKSGNIIGAINTWRDISELRNKENALQQLASELEERVRERTHELEQATKAKDEFLANMSHEIRTPMAGVLGLTEILLHQELPSKVEADVKMIRSSADSVLTLLNDLFDLSRISQGKFDFHPTEFDLPLMIDKALGPFRYQAMAKDLDLIVFIDESVPSQILCDKDRFGQVIKNLVSNAIKFTDHGFVKVEVNSKRMDDETITLFVSVSDSGRGIPKSKQKDVFNAFMQLDSSYSKKFAGMGLGLAISKNLVEGMGGEITVESTEGEGATFSFFITCGWVSQEQMTEISEITISVLPPMIILLVEDNPVNRLFLRRALIQAGHSIVEAENGREALENLSTHPIDLILMDIQMPEMDGIEATRQIRAGVGGKPVIPIIALTAYAMKGDRERFLDNGMDGYVTKPVDFGELARTIAEVTGIPINVSNNSR
jgi:PAS domain S-box-containing protein